MKNFSKHYQKRIAELKDENARLKEENEKYRRVFQGEKDWVLMEPGEHARLKAEVERLTEMGDLMADLLDGNGYRETMKHWNAAKEGKQS